MHFKSILLVSIAFSASLQGTLDQERRADLPASVYVNDARDAFQEQTLWLALHETAVEWSHRDELSFATLYGSDSCGESQIVFCPDISARDPPYKKRYGVSVYPA